GTRGPRNFLVGHGRRMHRHPTQVTAALATHSARPPPECGAGPLTIRKTGAMIRRVGARARGCSGKQSMNRARLILGRRRRHASKFAHALTEAVDGAQRQTAARLVVVLRASSGSYLDVAYLVGALAAFLGLLLILFLPGTIHVYAVPI